MDSVFSGIPLIRKDGSPVNPSDLQGKVIGIYFSAHWCPPCRYFTPLLKGFYDRIGDDFEIVFVSSDRSESDLKNYMAEAHGNWLYIPFGNDGISTLENKFDIDSIPTLIILKPDGSVVTEDGRDDVESSPSPKKTIQKWRS